MSTTTSPRKKDTGQAPALGVGASLRWLWTQITSMRTALILLFLVALAAIPGSLIPQRPVSPIRVLDFKRDHPQLDRFYEPLGLYAVYTSPWFSAFYLLLFVSLIGCIVPRLGTYARALRTPPPKLPGRLNRLPEFRSVAVADPDAALSAAEQWLRSKRFRTARTEQGVSAERGYLRELGNLIFHLGMIFVLVGIAWSNLLGFRGTSVVVEGQGFANNITQYDDFSAGAWVDTDDLPPFTVRLDQFIVEFETGEVQRGAARKFEAHVQFGEGGQTRPETIKVNHPLTLADGTLVHLMGHGYAPHITVHDGNGDVAFSGPVIFLPQDGNFTSHGVVKVPDARPERMAFQGYFLPTAVVNAQGPHSIFPDALNPEMFLNAWHGPPRTETGRPENVYTLDVAGLKQFTGQDGQVVALRLKPGFGATLPDGSKITFDGYSRWVKLQTSRTPGIPLTLLATAISVAGLCLSLFVRPRRLFVKTTSDGIEVGGLDRADARAGLSDDVTALTAAASGQAADEVATNGSVRAQSTGGPELEEDA